MFVVGGGVGGGGGFIKLKVFLGLGLRISFVVIF
jgi:hypothetical protein